MYWFGGPLSKLGISAELNIQFVDAVHQIEGNYQLYNMKHEISFSKSIVRKYHILDIFSQLFEFSSFLVYLQYCLGLGV